MHQCALVHSIKFAISLFSKTHVKARCIVCINVHVGRDRRGSNKSTHCTRIENESSRLTFSPASGSATFPFTGRVKFGEGGIQSFRIVEYVCTSRILACILRLCSIPVCVPYLCDIVRTLLQAARKSSQIPTSHRRWEIYICRRRER